ncbi:MAG: allantoate amidohydrolase [Terracidiphilus sp.]
MRERAQRAIEACRRIAAMTEEPGRITRRFLTLPVHELHAFLGDRMRALSMEVRVDAVGNLRGVWRPQGAGPKRIVMGSHIDTVPDAGAFDGVLGVTMALELVALAQAMAKPAAMEVIAFSEEEDVRFNGPFLSSRAVAGRWDPALLEQTDIEGVTLAEAIRAFGLDPDRVSEAVLDEDAAAFVEFHIEQGPVLEAEGLQVAAVTGIVGQSRLDVEFDGEANHAGTTPMRLRRDAMSAAAEWVLAVEAAARAEDGMVATVGRVQVSPGAANVIPGAAKLSLDARHFEDRTRKSMVERLLEQARAIGERRGVRVSWEARMDVPAVPMEERLSAYLCEAMEAEGLPAKRMASGAGHDAMVMAGRVPTAMLFIRSPGGVSHNPAETVRQEDVETALRVGARFLERLAAGIR